MAEVQKKEFVCTGRLRSLMLVCFFTVSQQQKYLLRHIFAPSSAHAFQDAVEGQYLSSFAWLLFIF